MKKKLALIAAVFLFLGIVVKRAGATGDLLNTPEGPTQTILADYGGVDVATSAFNSNAVTATYALASRYVSVYGESFPVLALSSVSYIQQRWRIYGVNFSTGLCTSQDSVSIYQSTSGWSNRQLIATYYNTTGSTMTTNANNASCGGFPQWQRWPQKASGNLFFQPSSNAYNFIGVYLWKEER